MNWVGASDGKPFVKQVGADIWWAHVKRYQPRIGSGGQVAIAEPAIKVEFNGDLFQGPYAEALARAWMPT